MNPTRRFVETVRLIELESAVKGLPHAHTVLEVGAGTGFQARELDRLGFKVDAVDIPDGDYTRDRIWPVRDYDGHRLPFPDESFDVVFSSNVLEHVVHLRELLDEQLRVLRRGGTMVHVVPSATWRLYTSMTYYPSRAMSLLNRAFNAGRRRNVSAEPRTEVRSRAIGQKVWPPVHGVGSSAFTEMLEFRRSHWIRIFSDLPVSKVRYAPAGVFYTGYQLSGSVLPISFRRTLARVLGSSCHVFWMQKP